MHRKFVIDQEGWVNGDKLHFVEIPNYRAVCGTIVDDRMHSIPKGTVILSAYPPRFCRRCLHVLKSRKRRDRADEVG